MPKSSTIPFTLARLRPHVPAGILGLVSLVLFWAPLRQLVSLSLDDRRYSHLVLIPAISAFFLYRERHRIFRCIAPGSAAGLTVLAAALAFYGLLALRIVPISSNYWLSLTTFAFVLVWAAGFAVCYGAQAFRAALFPILLLLLLVPVPFDAMDRIIAALQRGSSEATYALFRLAGVPMFREGIRFELPGVGIEVAKECSAIHSAWALFITGVLVAHMLLRSLWSKVCLSILTVPIAMGTNAVRIVTIWFLGTKVDAGFFYGHLHRDGGILFSLVSLSVVMGCLFLLRQAEGHAESGTADAVQAPPAPSRV